MSVCLMEKIMVLNFYKDNSFTMLSVLYRYDIGDISLNSDDNC